MLKILRRVTSGTGSKFGTEVARRYGESLGDKGRFHTRVVFGECALVPVFVLGEHANVPSFKFSFRGNIRMYPRPVFVPGEHPPKLPFCQHPFVNPRERAQKCLFSYAKKAGKQYRQ